MAVPQSGLQGPCPICSGYFVNLKAHYEQAHGAVQKHPGICNWCHKWAEDLPTHLAWHESQGLWHKFWNRPLW